MRHSALGHSPYGDPATSHASRRRRQAALGEVADLVAAGGAVFGAGVANRVLSLSSAARVAGPMPQTLTEREQEVLSLVADGLSNAHISRAMGLSLKTIQNYVSRILDKLQVADRTQAALLARDHRR